MADNQPTVTPETDKELEGLRGKVPGIEEELDKGKEEVVEVPKEPEKPAEPPKKDEAKPDDGKDTTRSKKEDTEEKPRASRPEKYIPIKQYTDEKNQWKEKGAALEKRIADLETIGAGKEGSKKVDAAIKDYAEKYDVSEESVRELAEIWRQGEEKPEPKDKKPEESKLSADDQARIEHAQEIEAVQLYNKEYAEVAIPELKNLFPKASAEQLAAAKDEVEKLATSKEYLDKSLDFIVYKERQALAELFSAGRKGPEGGGKPPENGTPSYTAADFNSGKTPFSELSSLSAENLDKVVSGMDVKTYMRFSHWAAENDGLVVTRGGKKIIYKT